MLKVGDRVKVVATREQLRGMGVCKDITGEIGVIDYFAGGRGYLSTSVNINNYSWFMDEDCIKKVETNEHEMIADIIELLEEEISEANACSDSYHFGVVVGLSKAIGACKGALKCIASS